SVSGSDKGLTAAEGADVPPPPNTEKRLVWNTKLSTISSSVPPMPRCMPLNPPKLEPPPPSPRRSSISELSPPDVQRMRLRKHAERQRANAAISSSSPPRFARMHKAEPYPIFSACER